MVIPSTAPPVTERDHSALIRQRRRHCRLIGYERDGQQLTGHPRARPGGDPSDVRNPDQTPAAGDADADHPHRLGDDRLCPAVDHRPLADGDQQTAGGGHPGIPAEEGLGVGARRLSASRSAVDGPVSIVGGGCVAGETVCREADPVTEKAVVLVPRRADRGLQPVHRPSTSSRSCRSTVVTSRCAVGGAAPGVRRLRGRPDPGPTSMWRSCCRSLTASRAVLTSMGVLFDHRRRRQPDHVSAGGLPTGTAGTRPDRDT